MAEITKPLRPLTTLWSRPSDCQTEYGEVTNSAWSGSFFMQAIYNPKTACWPPGTPEDNKQVYSPGLCPEGYTTIAKKVNANALPTTTATCCLIGYSTLHDAGMGGPPLCATHVLQNLTRSDNNRKPATNTPVMYVAAGIQVAAAETDMAVLAPVEAARKVVAAPATFATISSPSSTSGAPQSTGVAGQPAAEVSQPSAAPEGMGPGTAAGITIGAVAGALLIAGAVILWLRMRRRGEGNAGEKGPVWEEKKQPEPHSPSYGGSEQGATNYGSTAGTMRTMPPYGSEQGTTPTYVSHPASELHPNSLQEAPTTTPTPNLYYTGENAGPMPDVYYFDDGKGGQTVQGQPVQGQPMQGQDVQGWTAGQNRPGVYEMGH